MKTEFAREEKAGAEAVKAAEKILIKQFHPEKIARSEYKANKEFVTATDIASNRAIQEVLHKLTPDIPVVSEEGPAFDYGLSTIDSRHSWLIDPLDGTTNFVIGLPLFGVMLALLQDGEPVIGWISLPLLQEYYVARLNQGAWRNGKKFHLTQKLPLEDSVGLVCHGYAADQKAADMRSILPLMKATHSTRRIGAACIEAAWVATGRASYLVIHGAKPWDLAAGTLLVTEAGGLVSKPDGSPWTLNDGDCVAANPASYETVIKTLKNT